MIGKKTQRFVLGEVRHILDASTGDTDTGFDNIAASIKILAGDFNSTANEQPIQEVRYMWEPVSKKGVDYRSWPAVNPAIILDHIFTFKRPLSVKNIRIN
ncbi:hypothetical protein MASR2M36_36360 [Providencia sp.]